MAVEELAARAKSAKRHQAAADEDLARIRELLPVVRAIDPKKYGPKTLEELILGLHDRSTISRWTSEAAGTQRKKADEPAA